MDNVIKSDVHFQAHNDTLTHVQTQPTENIILDRNAKLRNAPGAINDLGGNGSQSWGRQIASIPLVMYEAGIRAGYDMNSKDSKHAEKEMHRYLLTEEGKKCMVRSTSESSKRLKT